MRSRVAAGALLALVAFFFITPAAKAQDLSLDEILHNYYEAVGGLEAWKAVTSIRIVGTTTTPAGLSMQVTNVLKEPMLSFLEHRGPGVHTVSGFDGEIGWIVNWAENGQPRLLEGNELDKKRMNSGDVDGVFVGYAEAGHEIKVVGLAEVDDTETYKLKLTLANGDVEYWYFDAESFLPIMSEYSFDVGGTTYHARSVVSDYKDIGGGLMHAHRIDSEVIDQKDWGMVAVIEKVEVDADVDDSIFKLPQTKGAK